jgi:2-oxoglutarate dehydrogenase E2 component (dihydrolipoamide succinyltransferase)
MSIELKVPAVGESITEVEIGEWRKSEGDRVSKDEVLVEIETDKATVELPAPVSGVLMKILKHRGEAATVGEVIAQIDVAAGGAGDAVATAVAKPAQEKPEAKAEPRERIDKKPLPPKQEAPRPKPPPPGQQTNGPAPAGTEAPIRPAPRGKEKEGEVEELPPLTTPRPAEAEEAEAQPGLVAEPRGRGAGPREEEEVPMSPIRRRIAQRLVEAQQTAALLTTFNEIDMSAVQAMRHEYRESFEAKYGVRLGLMSFFVKASIDTLKLVPQINAEIRGRVIVYRNYYDIGIAMAGGKGLVVPVLRNAERMSFAEIESAIKEFADRARANKVTLEELEGGTFTITNGGVFGSLLSTPIINPPQSGILGLHAIQDRPVARDGQVVIRPMMYVALTYDHRIVDGREAVMFLKHIKELIETPARMLIEI